MQPLNQTTPNISLRAVSYEFDSWFEDSIRFAFSQNFSWKNKKKNQPSSCIPFLLKKRKEKNKLVNDNNMLYSIKPEAETTTKK